MISVISINLNNKEGLRKTIESLYHQTYENWELIVIDGGSSDGSQELFSEYKRKPNYFISERDNGMYDAMNKGIRKANGNFIMFLNSGDYLLNSNVFQKAINCTADKEADIFFGDIEIKGRKGVERICHSQKPTVSYWKNATINHQAAFYRRQLFEELGLYDLKYTLAADHAFHIKAAINGKKFRHLDFPMVHYDVTGESSRNFRKYRQEMSDAFNDQVPEGLQTLILEHEKNHNLLQHKIVAYAVRLDKQYQRFQSFKKNKSGR